MKNKISNKLYGALLRCGTPPEIAAAFAKNAEFLGESNDETLERDNYEIMVTAKALSSLIKRHGDAANFSPSLSQPTSSAIPKVQPTINDSATQIISTPEEPETKDTGSVKKSAFWTKLETMPQWLRNTLSIAIPILMYLSMVILTVAVVGLIGACILGMIALTVIGIIMFFVGLLYGVSQISVFPAAAFYEIGLGLILGGTSSLLIVLLYNTLTKLLPSALRIGIKHLGKMTAAFRKFRADMKEKAVNQ